VTKNHTLRLAFFDVDGTLKEERDPYVYLHRHLGTEKGGLAVLGAFLAGQIDYEAFAQRDAALWAGVEVARVDVLFAAVPYVPEARVLAEALVAAGVPIVLVSTGVDRHVRQVAADLAAAAWVANELLVADGRLTGAMRVHVPWGGKGPLVREFMARFGARPEECLAVGDGTGDLPMFAEVGHRIAVRSGHAAVRAAADVVLGEAEAGAWLAERGLSG
jgi:phosphoserine phosphatase